MVSGNSDPVGCGGATTRGSLLQIFHRLDCLALRRSGPKAVRFGGSATVSPQGGAAIDYFRLDLAISVRARSLRLVLLGAGVADNYYQPSLIE